MAKVRGRWLFALICAASVIIVCRFFWPPSLSVQRMFARPSPEQNHSHPHHDGISGNGPQTANPSQTIPNNTHQTQRAPKGTNQNKDLPSDDRDPGSKSAAKTVEIQKNDHGVDVDGGGNEQTQAIIVTQTSMDYNGRVVVREVPPKEGATRFLIFECLSSSRYCGGWADRQEGLVTVFLLAYLTKRRFGIRMDTPCQITNFVVPNEYNWVVPEAELKGKPTRIIPAIDRTPFSAEMSTVDLNAKYKEDVVILRTNRDLFNDIRANPHYRDVLPSWARQARPEFFRDVWHTLMKPSPDVQQRLERFLQSMHYFNRTRPLVGMHVRIGGSKTFADGNMGDRLKYIGALWDFAQPSVGNGSDVFVATDNPDVLKRSAAKFGSHHHDAAAVILHIDRQRSDPSICQAFRGAVLDQLILSRCDILVLSPESGFSGRAAMMRGMNKQLFEFNVTVYRADMYKLCEPIC